MQIKEFKIRERGRIGNNIKYNKIKYGFLPKIKEKTNIINVCSILISKKRAKNRRQAKEDGKNEGADISGRKKLTIY